ncbi:hypothetical protein AncyloWKF20_12860 [Ancylobacter sp. WKF20]|uniref:hypothetical protein n=1 Tax=Ancylobacter sp. WKF20 TaxID=3039801 RepID=UPI0024345235|nr:hypothetical protein [Ancylobacter sp. WKF20]WGD28694.1 hypothetical protein AncyloWKF20_12860 [Ancylobacter sp. WKF20]
MMLRFSRAGAGRKASAPSWTWQARIPALIFAYGGATLVVLMVERLLHSAMSANYAAIAVVPGEIAAGILAFALAFRPRAFLFVLGTVTLVALLPLAVIVLSMDFGEYRAIVEQRALILAGVMALANLIVTSLLIAGGVFPAREGEAA